MLKQVVEIIDIEVAVFSFCIDLFFRIGFDFVCDNVRFLVFYFTNGESQYLINKSNYGIINHNQGSKKSYLQKRISFSPENLQTQNTLWQRMADSKGYRL
jgi:hypothetical protein